MTTPLVSCSKAVASVFAIRLVNFRLISLRIGLKMFFFSRLLSLPAAAAAPCHPALQARFRYGALGLCCLNLWMLAAASLEKRSSYITVKVVSPADSHSRRINNTGTPLRFNFVFLRSDNANTAF